MEPKDPSSPIDFDTVPPAGPAKAVTCTSCKREISGQYYEVGGRVICGRCRAILLSQLNPSSGRSQRFAKALGLGIAGAAAGSAIYYIVREVTGFDIGLVAVVVGFLAGKGVRKGSGGRGGRRYQILAVVLTYFAMSSTYVPVAMKELKGAKTRATDSTAVRRLRARKLAASKPQVPDSAAVAADSARPVDAEKVAVADSPVVAGDSVARANAANDSIAQKLGSVGAHRSSSLSAGEWIVGVLALFLLLAGLPVLAGFGSPLSLIFLVIAIMQAWKINRAVKITITGPYQIGGPQAPAPAAAT